MPNDLKNLTASIKQSTATGLGSPLITGTKALANLGQGANDLVSVLLKRAGLRKDPSTIIQQLYDKYVR